MILSLANFVDHDASGTITLNDGLLYQIKVTNAGNAPLFNILVRDITFGIPFTCPATSLTAGAGMLCTTNSPHTVTLIESNAGKVMMNVYAAGDYGSASYTQTVGLTTPVTQNPSIQLLKSLASLDDNDSSGTITQNDGLWYRFELTNTGNVTVSNLRVTDTSFNLPVACPPVSLAPGNIVTCNTTTPHLVSAAEATVGEATNTATASVDFGAATYSDSDTLVIPLSIQLVKSLSTYDDNDISSTITLGDALWYQFEITNIGSLALNNISVADNTFGILVTCPTTTLAPGASMTCTAGSAHTVTLSEANTGNVHNAATVTGRPPSGPVVMDTDSIDTSVIGNAGLSISKSASPLTYDTTGQVIDYTFVVTNTGNVTVYGPITIDDDKATDESCPAGNLDPGNSITCTATYTVTQADLDSGSVTNVTLATGAGPGGSPAASAPDTFTVLAAQNPGIQIVKLMASYTDSDGSSSITLGDKLWYRFNISNTGNVTLDPITVTDDSFSIPVTCLQPTLAPGASMSCLADAPHTITVSESDAGQVSNTATVTGELNGAPYTATDTVTIPVSQVPGILLVKSLQTYADNDSSGSITLGDGLLYQFTVTNTGNVSLSNLSVSDDTFGIPVNCSVTTLAPANSTICIALAAHTITLAEADAGQISNSATASAEFNAVPYTSTDTLTTSIQQNPAITLSKSGNPLTYSSPGQVITYTYTIQNTGDVTLAGPFSITDNKTGTIDPCGSDPLIPGAATGCTATYAVTQYDLDFGSLTNSATAHTSFSGAPVASSPDSVTATAIQSPSYTIAKSVTDVGGDGPGGHANQAGDVISYQITLVNTGNVSLIGASASDPLLGTLTRPVESGTADGILAVGETWTYNGAYIVTQVDLENNSGGDGNIDNTALATTTFLPTPQTASASVPVDQSPALTLNKSADLATYDVVGQTITYTYTIENSGNLTLAGPFTVDDDVQGALTDCASGPLAPLATDTCTSTHTVTQADIDAGGLTNTATASGNGVTSPADSITVNAVQSLALTLTKSADLTSYASVGQVITYTYAIKNDGNVTLAGPFTVDDDKQGVLADCASGPLAPAATTSCSSTYAITQADIDVGSLINTATASGNSVTSAPDSVTVNAIQSPELTLTMSADLTTYDSVGQVITYTYTIENSGNVTLAGPFTVDDDKQGTLTDCAAGPLAPVATITCTATHIVTQADLDAGSITNSATASGNSITSAPDSLTVTAIQNPELTLSKTADRANYATAGQVITYRFDVTNTGNVTITGPITADDNLTTNETCPAGDLAPGASISCSATYLVAQNDLDTGSIINTASASGTDPNSNLVASATDTLSIPAIQTPSIQIVKSMASYTDNDTTWNITRGDDLWYQFELTNLGNVTLTNVSVTDETFAIPVTCPATTLAPSEEVVCTADSSHVITPTEADAGQVSNTALAQGEFNSAIYTAYDTLVTIVNPVSLSVISGQVRDDSNGNGNLGDNDAGLANIRIELDDGICTLGVDCRSATTVTNGVFTFNTVSDGSYILVENDLAAYISTADSDPPNDNQIDVIILSGLSSTNNVFLDTVNPAFCSAPHPSNGFVVSTNPSNGVTNVPLSTAILTVTFNQPMITAGAESVLLAGKYELKNTSNGKIVTVSGVTYDPAAYTATLTIDTSDPDWQAGTLYNLTIKNLRNACGIAQTNVVRSFTTELEISGQVLNNLDSKGIYGVRVELTGGSCGGSCGVMRTDLYGKFRFTGFAPGNYTLTETNPPGFNSVNDSNPPNDNLINLTLAAGSNSTGHTFIDTPAVCSVPSVAGTNPTNRATGIPLRTSTLTVTFNQPMVTYGAGSIFAIGNFDNNIDNLSLGGDVPILDISYNPDTYTATLTINTSDPQWQAGSQFRLRIKSSLKNPCGTNLGSDVDVLFTTGAFITGQVRNSLDGKGVYGAPVELTGVSCGGSCGSTTTDLNGGFNFSGVTPGSYTLLQTNLPGYMSLSDSNPPNDDQITLTLTPGSNSTGHLFTDTPSCIGGANFVASSNPANNATGISLSITTVTVTFNQPMVTYGGGSVLELGNFDNNLDNLTLGGDVPILDIAYDPNTYTATLVIDTSDPQWRPGSQFRLHIKDSIKNACDGRPAANTDILFTTDLVVSGQVREDLDGDGDLSDLDPGISGVMIELYDGACVLLLTCQTTATNSGGFFTFDNLEPGNYTLYEIDPLGYVSTADSDGGNSNQIAVNLAAGTNSIGNKFLDKRWP